MGVPLLDHMVHQFRTRGEYSRGERKADGYGDGTFIHAWLPGLFADAALMEVRGGEVLHVTSFTPENERRAKEFTMEILLEPEGLREGAMTMDHLLRLLTASGLPHGPGPGG